MKALLLHHPYTRPRFEQDFVDRIGELPEFDVARADLDALSQGRLASPGRDIVLSRWDAIIVFVSFTALRKAQPLQWDGFAGLRVLLDHDIIQNYSDLFDPTLYGLWPEVFRRHRFDSMVTSGRTVQQRLGEDGIAADWVAKGFEPSRCAAREGPREGVVRYGSTYTCRAIAERAIKEAGLPLSRIAAPYPELGAVLGRFLACMAVSSDLCVPIERRPYLDNMAAREVPMRPGIEPMAKFFEAAGASCCPIADAMEDLGVLGFRHGENAILFSSHGELVEQLGWWLARPEQLRTLGRAASALAHKEHTWAHRAQALRAAITRRLSQHGS